MFLFKNVFFITFLSVIFSLYCGEFYLEFKSKNNILLSKSNKFDTRTIYQVYKKLKKKIKRFQ